MTHFPSGGRAVVDAMCAKFPELFVNEDDKQRVLIERIGEQFTHTYGPQWGNKKRAGLSDAFRSKDSIAVKEPDGSISVWDVFQGSSPVVILVQDGTPPDHPKLSTDEATFMACQPFDHLGMGGGSTEPPSSDLEARVEALEYQNAEQQNAINQQLAIIASHTSRLELLEAEFRKTWKVKGFTSTTAFHRHVLDGEVVRD